MGEIPGRLRADVKAEGACTLISCEGLRKEATSRGAWANVE